MKISVIVPSFNQGQFISRTIESILTQEGNFEVECIVFDGGSSDETVEILKETDKRIAAGIYKNYNKGVILFWVSKKDKGQSDAINQGLKKSTGDILAYLNSDDSYTNNSFKTVVDGFTNNNKMKWLTGHCNVIDQNDQPIRNLVPKYKNYWLSHYSYTTLLILNFISQPATFWKKEIFSKYGSFNENLHFTMDYDYWLRIGKQNQPLIIKKPLANFRIHGQSKGETAFSKQFDQDLACAKKNTKNKFIILLHFFHNLLIKTVYRIIK